VGVTSKEARQEYVEQLLLFDPTKYIELIDYIGDVAIGELIIIDFPQYEEPDPIVA
jgi:hypothetical protein